MRNSADSNTAGVSTPLSYLLHLRCHVHLACERVILCWCCAERRTRRATVERGPLAYGISWLPFLCCLSSVWIPGPGGGVGRPNRWQAWCICGDWMLRRRRIRYKLPVLCTRCNGPSRVRRLRVSGLLPRARKLLRITRRWLCGRHRCGVLHAPCR